MKILLGVPEYPPYHVGGGGEVFKNLAEQYKKSGHDVVVMYGYYPTKSWTEDIKEYTDEMGIKFYQIPEIPFPKSKPFLRTVMPPNLKAWRKLNSIIKKEKPDVAHLHGYGFVLINKIAYELRKLNTSYVFTLHGAPVSPNKFGGIILFVYVLYQKYARNTLGAAKFITAVSNYTKSFSEFKKYKEKIRLVNNGIFADCFSAQVHTKNIFSQYIDNPTKKTVLFSMGRVEWLKGFQNVIEIIPKLIIQGFDVHYFIAGRDNGYQEYLLKLTRKLNIENRVNFLGQLNFDEKNNALHSCNLVLVPSLIENYPAVTLEAMAARACVVVNNAGGMPEQIQQAGNAGMILDFDNTHHATLQLAELLHDNKRLLTMKQKGALFVQTLKWERIAEKYLELLSETRHNV